MIPPHNSLVKYDNPILVSTNKDTKKSGKSGKGGDKKDDKKSHADGRHTSQTEDILNSILPPREWTEVSGHRVNLYQG